MNINEYMGPTLMTIVQRHSIIAILIASIAIQSLTDLVTSMTGTVLSFDLVFLVASDTRDQSLSTLTVGL